MGLLVALGGAHADLFSEETNHASLIDGARLSRSKVQVYPHCDASALADMLAQSQAEVKLVVTDSVFSMDGDIAPLPALLRLCEKHGAWLVVDDAHGFGLLGEQGRGALSHFNLESKHLVYMGTLGKAAGVSGAFVAAHEVVIDWLVQRARQYIYTTASPPALAHALQTSLDIIESDEGDARRAHLKNLIAHFRKRLGKCDFELPESHTAIQPVIVGSNERALALAAGLQERGIWVPAIRPPTVPVGRARLRVTLSAAHSLQQVDGLCDALIDLSVRAA
jgi:8-amino-7-oxononanoate synthase